MSYFHRDALGKKPDSLSRPLKELVDRGLIERCGKGRYRPTDNWQQVLDRERTLTGEKRAERLDEQQYEREREAYRQYLAHKEGGREEGVRRTLAEWEELYRRKRLH
jgi:DNA-binding transcriptional ArsR family regulator